MAYIRFKGFQVGTKVDVSVTGGGEIKNLSVAAFRAPATASRLPRIDPRGNDFTGATWALDETGLTGVTARNWRVVGGATQSTAATLDTTGLGGRWIECELICDQGTLVTPALMVCAMSMMADIDQAIISLGLHKDATHIAITDGDWTSPVTWLGSRVPGNGARVLIPHGRTVTYDNAKNHIRLDWVRVDGTLDWALDRSTTMLVETLVGTRGSTITIGKGFGNRLPAQYQAEVIISGRHYRDNSYTATDINLSRDADLWGRGFVSLGTVRIWPKDVLTGCLAAEGISSGATSLTLEETPIGWTVGDQIIISGTSASLPVGVGTEFTNEDEVVTIDTITDKTISWTGGLSNDHNNQNPNSVSTEVRPYVMFKEGQNVIIRSEVSTPNYRRGHFSMVHHHSVTDIWGGDFKDLGRNDKIEKSGKKNGSGDFEFTGDVPVVLGTETFDAQSNIIGRYSLHLHHVGFEHAGTRPIVSKAQIWGSPGWGIVHHSCDVDLFSCTAYDCRGCGIVAEQGDELGFWDKCAVGGPSGVTSRDGDSVKLATSAPKGHMTDDGRGGADLFREGYGFGFRGRAVVTTRCVAFSCTWGYVFYQRRVQGQEVQSPAHPKRSRVPLKDIGLIQANDYDFHDYQWYPIENFDDNTAIATLGGFFVTKNQPQQNHDVNIQLNRFTSWGHRLWGAGIEYVGTYILRDWHCVAGAEGVGNGIGQEGIHFSSNAFQIALVNCRTEGHDNAGLYFFANSPGTDHRGFNNTTEPRWMAYGYESVNDVTANGDVITYNDSGNGDVLTDTFIENPDWDNTSLDYSAAPSEDFPLVVGEWAGGASTTMNTVPTNSDGGKDTNLALNTPLIKNWLDGPLNVAGLEVRGYAQEFGYYQYGGNDVLVQTVIISDQLTGRPHKVTKLWDCAATPSASANNGAWTHVSTPVTTSDVEIGVTGSSDTTDMTTGASGGNGSFTVDTRDFIRPSYGTLEIDGSDVTYTPHVGYTGTDKAGVFIKSGDQYAYKEIHYLVGAGGTPDAPVVDTNFSIADGGSQSIDVTLTDKPDAKGRHIRIVMYSTDGGSSWRRLCNRWVKGTHNITVESDGTAIAAGNYKLRLRYYHDHENDYAAASGDDSTTVA